MAFVRCLARTFLPVSSDSFKTSPRKKKKQTYALIKYRAKKNLPLLQAGPRAGCAAGSNADCLAAQLAAQLAAIDVSKRGSQLQTRTPNHSTRTTYLSLRSWS
jgi:hypothetical protein